MSDDERIDREAILKRRLLLIGGVLAGLGAACSSKSEPPPEPCLSPPPNPCLSPLRPDQETTSTSTGETTATTGTGSGTEAGGGGAPPHACLSPLPPKK
ncbi:MAG: hypothetical protein HOV80_37410 [Polyangiaceae bacterium]|nr:hypothetical protein [Polyangiaceae bacterium]